MKSFRVHIHFSTCLLIPAFPWFLGFEESDSEEDLPEPIENGKWHNSV